MGAGRGYWRYVPTESGTRFITGYDDEPGYGWPGAVLDRVITRRIIEWMTALSFDRLRIWAESDVEPEHWNAPTAFMFWRKDRPRASHCLRKPPTRPETVMDNAPATLNGLETP